MTSLLAKWIKGQVASHEQWIDYLRETSQDQDIPFYAGVRQGLLDVLEQLEGEETGGNDK